MSRKNFTSTTIKTSPKSYCTEDATYNLIEYFGDNPDIKEENIEGDIHTSMDNYSTAVDSSENNDSDECKYQNVNLVPLKLDKEQKVIFLVPEEFSNHIEIVKVPLLTFLKDKISSNDKSQTIKRVEEKNSENVSSIPLLGPICSSNNKEQQNVPYSYYHYRNNHESYKNKNRVKNCGQFNSIYNNRMQAESRLSRSSAYNSSNIYETQDYNRNSNHFQSNYLCKNKILQQHSYNTHESYPQRDDSLHAAKAWECKKYNNELSETGLPIHFQPTLNKIGPIRNKNTYYKQFREQSTYFHNNHKSGKYSKNRYRKKATNYYNYFQRDERI